MELTASNARPGNGPFRRRRGVRAALHSFMRRPAMRVRTGGCGRGGGREFMFGRTTVMTDGRNAPGPGTARGDGQIDGEREREVRERYGWRPVVIRAPGHPRNPARGVVGGGAARRILRPRWRRTIFTRSAAGQQRCSPGARTSIDLINAVSYDVISAVQWRV